jgi:PKD repeat protein
MKKLFFKITILVVLFLIPKIVFGNVVIDEVLYNPSTTSDTGKEYIRLYNNGDSVVDLTNWDIDPSSANYFTIPSFTLNAKTFITIRINTSGTNSDTDIYTGTLSNMSDTEGPIAIFSSTSHTIATLIDYIEYGAGGQVNESKAVSAGLWTTGNFIPNVSAPGKAIKLKTDGVDNNSPSDWIETEPSVIQEEPEQTPEQPEAPPMPTGPNTPPIAEAGDNIIAFVNQEIKLDGSKSSDPENQDLQYSWNTGDGNSSDHQIVTHKYLYPGTYLAALTVYDGMYYNTDTITIKIQNQGIIINEFMANPSNKDEEEEWIEIYNDADEIMDISGWQLNDAASKSQPFIFPENTLIAPKSYVVFAQQVTGIALNNDKDSLRLLMPEGIVFQEINYEKPPIGKSSARFSDGFIWSEPSPGTANIVLATFGVDENKKFIYQNPIKPQIVQQPENYTISFQNSAQPEIKGGYQEIAMTDNQLASIKQPSQNKNFANLVLIIVIIILGASIIGILLIKFRRKNLIIK